MLCRYQHNWWDTINLEEENHNSNLVIWILHVYFAAFLSGAELSSVAGVVCWGGRVMCDGNKTTNDRSVVPVNYADVGLMYWYLMMALLDTTQRISYFYTFMPRIISVFRLFIFPLRAFCGWKVIHLCWKSWIQCGRNECHHFVICGTFGQQNKQFTYYYNWQSTTIFCHAFY